MSSRAAFETATEAETETEAEAERLDRVFGILQNRRRRLVLEFLRTRESSTQSNLARHVAAVENGISEPAVTSTQRKRVYVSLYQSHLPKLDDAGAVSFDRDRGTVERTPRTDDLLTYLDRIEDATETTTVVDESTDPSAVVFLCAALLVVFVGELGPFPEGLALGVAVLLSLAGLGAAVYDGR